MVDSAEVADCLPLDIWRLSRTTERWIDARLRLPWSAEEIAVCSLLTEGPASLTNLANSTGIATTTLSTMIRRLEKVGLIERSIDPEDKRVRILRLTDEGWSHVTEVRQRMAQATASLKVLLPDVSTLVAAIHKVEQTIRRELSLPVRETPEPHWDELMDKRLTPQQRDEVRRYAAWLIFRDAS